MRTGEEFIPAEMKDQGKRQGLVQNHSRQGHQEGSWQGTLTAGKVEGREGRKAFAKMSEGLLSLPCYGRSIFFLSVKELDLTGKDFTRLMTPSNSFSTTEKVLKGKMPKGRKTSSKATGEGSVVASPGAGVVAEDQGGSTAGC